LGQLLHRRQEHGEEIAHAFQVFVAGVNPSQPCLRAQLVDRHARILARITSVDQVLACRPQLIGVKSALEVVPGMRPDLILHAAPPTSWDELSPLLRSSLTAAAELDGIDCDEIMIEALRRGDELHNRNAAATSMLAERIAPGLARTRIGADLQERLFNFLHGNPQFFVAVSLAASKLMLDAAH